MVVDEKDVAQRQPVYELIDRLATGVSAERAELRKAHAELFAELDRALRAGELSLAGKLHKQIAARYSEAGFYGDAETHVIASRECSAELRRRNWIAKQGGRRR